MTVINKPIQQNMDKLNLYSKYIYQEFRDLLNSKLKKNYDTSKFSNTELWKIFEWFSCIKLNENRKDPFLLYNDIDPSFKEENNLTKTDSGIDACNLKDTIAQMKCYDHLTLASKITNFTSSIIDVNEFNIPYVRWKAILCIPDNCTLSEYAKHHLRCISQQKISRQELLQYCDFLIKNPPKETKVSVKEFEDRLYQQEVINMIKSRKENGIISLPTGTGKTYITVSSFSNGKKYIVFVPTIVLMDQWKDDIITINPLLEKQINCIGDKNSTFKKNCNITICVYNSIKHIPTTEFKNFERIFIDEAHRINNPQIYQDLSDSCDEEEDEEDDYNNEDEDEEDEDEEDDDDFFKKKYIDAIKSLLKYNNNVYLSATIDKKDGFYYYSKSIREMIDKNYLCDYSIHIPIFESDPTDYNICRHMIDNCRNTIVYCASRKEGKRINDILNSLRNKSSAYIDCETDKKKRKEIIDKYKKGTISILVNVNILTEGFDAPITKSVVLFHLPSSKTKIVQIVGRALRKHNEKTFAKIILPFCEEEDGHNINNFISTIAEKDERIKQSVSKKTLGGYINITKCTYKDQEEEEIKEEDQKELDLRCELIINSLGKCLNSNELYLLKLERYLNWKKEHGKFPSHASKDEKERKTAQAFSDLKKAYKKKKYYGMEEEDRRDHFKKFCQDNQIELAEEIREIETLSYEDKIKRYIDWKKEHGKFPSHASKDEKERKTAQAFSDLKKAYKKKKNYGMEQEEQRNHFKKFCQDNQIELSEDRVKGEVLPYEEKIKRYIDWKKEHDKFPSQNPNNKEEKKIALYFTSIKSAYKKKKNYGMDQEDRRNHFRVFCKENKIDLTE